MSSRDQPHDATPPFNSPYQQAGKPSSLLASPGYPLPSRSEAEASSQPPHGLGLYNYAPNNYASNTILLPPSPQPSEGWCHTSHPEPIVNPWDTGAYDHPVAESPMWNQHQYEASNRSPLSSSQREMSVLSGEGSEYGFVQVKLEAGSEWAADDHTPQGTISPTRLTTGSSYAYHPYSSPSMASSHTISASSYDSRLPEHMAQECSPVSSHSSKANGVRKRRKNKTAPEDAKFNCDICGRGFVRLYNKKSHMQRHDPKRAKDHSCPEHDCDREFERKADLDRHYKSVHAKLKDQMCPHCGKGFSRPDTLRRHVEDGCTSRNQLQGPLLTRSPMQGGPVSQQAYYPSPRPELYDSNQGLFEHNVRHQLSGAGYDARSSSMFRDNAFASPHGF